MAELCRREFDDLIAKGIATTDDAVRAEVYKTLQKKAYDLALSMYYVDAQDIRIHRDWVKGYVYSPAYSANYDFYEVWKEAK